MVESTTEIAGSVNYSQNLTVALPKLVNDAIGSYEEFTKPRIIAVFHDGADLWKSFQNVRSIVKLGRPNLSNSQ